MANPENPGRIKQIRMSYRMTKETDKRLGWILLAVFLFATAVGFALFSLIPGHWILDLVTGALIGLVAVLVVFGRRAQRAGYARIEGQPGAAAAALSMLRRGWKVEPAIAFNKQQDIVHRVVGPPGIVLIGEGNPGRLKGLLASERVKHQRVATETPIHEVVVGYGEGEVPVPKLVKHVTKLGRNVKGAELTDILGRLRALDAQRPRVPIPKGPVPTSMKGQRGNLRGR